MWLWNLKKKKFKSWVIFQKHFYVLQFTNPFTSIYMRVISGWRSKLCNENGRPNPTLGYEFFPCLFTDHLLQYCLCIKYTILKLCLVKLLPLKFLPHLNKSPYSLSTGATVMIHLGQDFPASQATNQVYINIYVHSIYRNDLGLIDFFNGRRISHWRICGMAEWICSSMTIKYLELILDILQSQPGKSDRINVHQNGLSMWTL